MTKIDEMIEKLEKEKIIRQIMLYAVDCIDGTLDDRLNAVEKGLKLLENYKKVVAND